MADDKNKGKKQEQEKPKAHFDENGMIVFDVPKDQPKKEYKGRMDDETGMIVFDEVKPTEKAKPKIETKPQENNKWHLNDAGMVVFDTPQDQPKKEYKGRMDDETGMFVFDEVKPAEKDKPKPETKPQEKSKWHLNEAGMVVFDDVKEEAPDQEKRKWHMNEAGMIVIDEKEDVPDKEKTKWKQNEAGQFVSDDEPEYEDEEEEEDDEEEEEKEEEEEDEKEEDEKEEEKKEEGSTEKEWEVKIDDNGMVRFERNPNAPKTNKPKETTPILLL